MTQSTQTQPAAPLARQNKELATVPESVKQRMAERQTEARNEAVASLVGSSMAKAGTLTLTPEETKKLTEDFPDDAFQPGASGKENLIYIEHAALRDRLNSVLGMGQWVLVVRETWNENFQQYSKKLNREVPAVRVYARAMLVVRGAYVGEAVGDMEYMSHNNSQNYGDAFEGAKTAALRRCCKEFGIGLQAWKKDWCDGWWQRNPHKRRDGQQRGPMPPMQRGTDLKTPQKRQQKAEPVQEAEVVDEVPPEVAEQLDQSNGPLTETFFITNIVPKEGKKKNGQKWKLWSITGDDGMQYGTFDSKIGNYAEEKWEQNIAVEVTYEQEERGRKILTIK